jgi:DNA-binding response OmpR family regulator
MKKIYVADDDKNIAFLIKRHLENAGYEVETFNNGKELLDRFLSVNADMIITDIMMPEMNGYELCREVRNVSMVPVFMISANNDEIDRILGLELGSDDYISKPISFRELLIKIRNTFSRIDRYQVVEDHSLTCYDLRIDKNNRQVFIKDNQIEVTTKEFELLLLFVSNKNQAFSREQIIESIWGYDYMGDSRQVDNMIKRLRKKILLQNAEFQIQTIWGYGYKVGE